MSPVLFAHGHLSWPVFAALVFTMSGLLLADLVWRLVSIRAVFLFPVLALVWAVGLVLIFLI